VEVIKRRKNEAREVLGNGLGMVGLRVEECVIMYEVFKWGWSST
jgi:hypothetical protein